jgi:hypothetical protein
MLRMSFGDVGYGQSAIAFTPSCVMRTEAPSGSSPLMSKPRKGADVLPKEHFEPWRRKPALRIVSMTALTWRS